MIANWCYKCNSPCASLSIHPGTSLGQVAWQPVQVPMNKSQCTLSEVRVPQDRDTATLEGWGYLEAIEEVTLRWENTWRKKPPRGKRENAAETDLQWTY